MVVKKIQKLKSKCPTLRIQMQPSDLRIKKRCRVCKKELILIYLKSTLLRTFQHPNDLDCTESRYRVFFKIPKHRKSLFKVCEGSERVLVRRMAIMHDAQALHGQYSYHFLK
jgi:hypothetical protein